jgi:peptide subunit release factor 1 (eRF1)
MKIKFTFFILSLFYVLTIGNLAIAQNDLQDKIDQIDGSVDKIIISSDGEEYIFEGADAQKLFKKMKSSKSKSFVWNTSDDGSMKKKIVIMDTDGEKEIIEIDGDDEDVLIVKSDDDFEWNSSDGMQKKVKVEIENGEKKVTITTKENGEEKTEVYEGDEADEYLEEMKSENDDLDIIIEKENGKKVKKIIIKTEKEEKKK